MYPQLRFETKDDFRKWLMENHDTCDGIWIIFTKSREAACVTYDEALEQALCFGWIDGQVKRIDDKVYIRKFTPRRKKSNWSERNKKIVAELSAQGLIQPAGYAAIERAKAEGMWNKAKAEPVTDEQIKILINAIDGAQPALENFNNMSPSVKKTYAAFYLNAKREDTRIRRLNKIIGRLNRNLKPM